MFDECVDRRRDRRRGGVREDLGQKREICGALVLLSERGYPYGYMSNISLKYQCEVRCPSD